MGKEEEKEPTFEELLEQLQGNRYQNKKIEIN